MQPDTIISEKKEITFREFLKNEIKEFNNQFSPYHRRAREPGSSTPLNLILQDDSGNVIGGLSASTYWGWLDVDDLFIPNALRGQGIGASLLQTAEAIAIRRGSIRSVVSTFEFQARLFYEQQGHRVVGELRDYPPDSAYYWMRKELPSKTTDGLELITWRQRLE